MSRGNAVQAPPPSTVPCSPRKHAYKYTRDLTRHTRRAHTRAYRKSRRKACVYRLASRVQARPNLFLASELFLARLCRTLEGHKRAEPDMNSTCFLRESWMKNVFLFFSGKLMFLFLYLVQFYRGSLTCKIIVWEKCHPNIVK